MRSTQFPTKLLSHKKAMRWLDEHPSADPVLFWIDQAEKHEALVRRWLIFALVMFATSAVLQIVGIILVQL